MSIVDKMVSLRLDNSQSLSLRSFISPICTSSSPPVASLRYRLINGMVAPPANNDNVLFTWCTATPSAVAIILLNNSMFIVFYRSAKVIFTKQKSLLPQNKKKKLSEKAFFCW